MMASKLLLQRRLFRFLQLSPYSLCSFSSSSSIHGSPFHSVKATEISSLSTSSRNFCSQKSNLVDQFHGPAPIDYSSLLQEGDFHRLAESTIHNLQEKFEDYGDSIDLDGFDIDYGNDVLTVKLGELGTYVLNKQTPNRQLWLSSPLSLGFCSQVLRSTRALCFPFSICEGILFSSTKRSQSVLFPI
ncbi:frataxin, mitochondrial isoform X2 [Trifolium pratense]|uniref:frataxin, mitochondrial isoform X2 n=1 Tax=Trifolium pratense TaxID=57577 RepID=UPI001E691658|nr:frataxin, mitochondrial isoform X2 [Trifolium pratense]